MAFRTSAARQGPTSPSPRWSRRRGSPTPTRRRAICLPCARRGPGGRPAVRPRARHHGRASRLDRAGDGGVAGVPGRQHGMPRAQDRVEGRRLGAHEGAGARGLHRAGDPRGGRASRDREVPPRLGEGAETAPDFARRMEEAGACAVTVHGRFAEQLYRGSADWDVVARVREAVYVPVIGNGDVRSGADAVSLTARDRLRRGDDRPRRRGQPVGVRPGARPRSRASRSRRPPMPASVSPWRAATRACSRVARGEHRAHAQARHVVPGGPAGRRRGARKINACVSVEDFDRVFDELLAFLGGHEQEG